MSRFKRNFRHLFYFLSTGVLLSGFFICTASEQAAFAYTGLAAPDVSSNTSAEAATATSTDAATDISTDHRTDGNPHVLVVFSSASGEVDEHQRMLDMLLGRFTEQIIFKASAEVAESDAEGADILLYYGEQRELLSQTFVDMAERFTGKMVVIGYNVEQLGDRFAFVDPLAGSAIAEDIFSAAEPDIRYSFIPHYLLNVSLAGNEHAETVLMAKQGNTEHPLLVRQHENYYFASVNLQPPFSFAFAEGLHEIFGDQAFANNVFEPDIFQAEPHQTYPGYIRLEDIHPMVDPAHMREIADMLKDKNIPYMVAVIPVYTNPDTGRRYHFSDFPELLDVLRYMQDNGGSMVLHGYTHQFRLSETGEGFEFWDVEHNMSIYHNQDDEVVVRTRADFASDAEYEQYVDGQKAFERNYIEERLNRGIQELANFGLYPLAFEAPHYTMSQHGYEVAAGFFSTYSGQLQLSDEDWEIMTTAPYVTKPTFLHGMTLLPETIGYVQPENPQAIESMMVRAGQVQFVRDGMVAGFYHPYLGVESFAELLEELEQLPVSWLDLKKLANHVRAEHVLIRTEDGQIIVDMNRTGLFMESRDYLYYHIKVFAERAVWVIAGIGVVAVVMFIFFIFANRLRYEPSEGGDHVG